MAKIFFWCFYIIVKLRDLNYIFGYQKIVKVDNNLLRGSAPFTPFKMARLKLNGVKQIIDLRTSSVPGSSTAKAIEKFYCKCFNIKYINMPFAFTNGYLPAENSFETVANKINENNLRTYIHCHYGRHRTGECVAFYQKQKNYNEDEIVKGLLDNGWNKKIDFVERSYKSLLMFLKKYFPAQKHIDKAEEYKKLFG